MSPFSAIRNSPPLHDFGQYAARFAITNATATVHGLPYSGASMALYVRPFTLHMYRLAIAMAFHLGNGIYISHSGLWYRLGHALSRRWQWFCLCDVVLHDGPLFPPSSSSLRFIYIHICAQLDNTYMIIFFVCVALSAKAAKAPNCHTHFLQSILMVILARLLSAPTPAADLFFFCYSSIFVSTPCDVTPRLDRFWQTLAHGGWLNFAVFIILSIRTRAVK